MTKTTRIWLIWNPSGRAPKLARDARFRAVNYLPDHADWSLFQLPNFFKRFSRPR